ncbi:MAG: hypothetical protein CME62_08195 [Halobacteriovoraceae bacterium]|nr:hypothetical protein [Halobacteriovoraceae bacterium]|tara:strand:- start:2188 stop:8853 length:6666 start_codon:yes stop_codon:yes gene_type:complete
MHLKLILSVIFLFLASCQESSEESSSGGLVAGHKSVDNSISVNYESDTLLGLGEHIDFKLSHPAKQTVTGTPRIILKIGSQTKYATYRSGNGTRNLYFRYTVQPGDSDNDGIEVLTPLIDLNGGNLEFYSSGIPQSTSLSFSLNMSDDRIMVDTASPNISGILDPSDDIYIEDDQLIFIVQFNEFVEVSGTPQLELNIGGSTKYAHYLVGSGTDRLLFSYDIEAGDIDTDGIELASPIELNNGSIQDLAGNSAALTFIPTAMPNVQVDTSAPYITNLELPTNNTYLNGGVLDFEITFNEAVSTTGSPRLPIDIGGNTVYASLISGNGSDVLKFRHIVTNNDLDLSGIQVESEIDLNGGSIRNASSTDAQLDFTSPVTPLLKVYGILPKIVSITAPTNDNYLTGETMDFVVEFNEKVIVVGSPQLPLTLESGNVYASYQSGSNSKYLTFRYTPSASDLDSNGIAFNGSSLNLNAGTIVSSFTSAAAILNFSGLAPVMNGVSVNANQATQLVITQQPSDAETEQTISPAITVELRDATNTLVNTSSAAVTVNFATDPSGGTASLSGSITVNAVNGVATFNDLSIDTADTGYTLSFTSAGLTSATSNSFDITPAPATQLEFIGHPSNELAGETISPTISVAVRNAYGGLDILATSPVTLSLANDASGGSATLSGTLTVTPILGVATFSDISLDKTGSGYTLEASATGLTSDTSNAFNIDANTATQLAFVQEPSDTQYDTVISPDITVEILDAYGNRTADTSDITIAFNNNPYSATLGGTLTTSAVNGLATFNDIEIDKVGSGYTLDASASGLSAATSNGFEITSGTPTQLAFNVQPVDTVAGVNISPAITVEIQDSAGNIVTSATDTITLSFNSDASGGSATLSGTLAQAAVNGVATFSDINIDYAASGYNLSAQAAGLTDAISDDFAITSASATQLAIVQQPSDAQAGSVISPAITVEVLDAIGNRVTTATDNITLSFANDASSGSATLGGTVTVAAINGLATFNDITIDKAASGYTLNATASGLTSSTTTSFNITPGAKATLAFTQEPSHTQYGVDIAPAVSVEIVDSYGNRTSDTDSITLSINNNPSSGTLSGTTTVSAVNGLATFSDLNIDNVGDGYTLDANATGLTGATSSSFNIFSIPTQLVITSEPTDTYNDFVIAPAITVEIRDASNNIVTSANDTVTLSFGTDPSGGSASIAGTTSIAAVNGVATFNDISIDTVNSGYTFSFSATGLTSATSTAFNITQAPATQLAFVQGPSDAIAGGNISPAITVELLDGNNNRDTSATDTVTLSFANNAGSGTLGGTLSVAAINGVATFSDINIDKAAAGYTLSANATGLSAATSNSFNITAAAKSQLVITTEPSDALKNTNINPAVVVEIQDAYGNKTNDSDTLSVAIANNPSSGTLSGTTNVSAVNGSASFSDLQINNSGSGYTLQFSATGLSSVTSTSFNITAIPTQLAFVTQPVNTEINNAIIPSLTVEVRDSTNSLVATATDAITLSFGADPSGGSATLSGTLTQNAVNGVATFNNISINQAHNGFTLSASATGLSSDTSTSFNIFDTTLAFSPTSAVNFGDVTLGGSADQTLLITHTGGTATPISETTLSAPFAFKGGSYPGTGGTCGSSINNNCTIVLSYTPTATGTHNGTVTIDYNSGTQISRSLTGQSISTTPTKLEVVGPNAVIATNSCVSYAVQAQDDEGNVSNVSATENITLIINNGTGSFYSDAACTNSITSTSIANGSSAQTIYFKSNTANQSLTLIFNGTNLDNTSRSINTSVEPTFISTNLPSEIIVDTCTLAEVSMVDPNGIKTGSASAKQINIAEDGDVQVFTDAFCTNQVTSLSYAPYEGSKFIYLKNAASETVNFTFSDDDSILTSAATSIDFVSNLTWWNTDYSKRVRISINNLDIPTSFTNMPVLVKLDSSKINYSDFLANGDDIRFVKDDHSTTLPYAIDTWNASGTSYIWVKLDSAPANSEINIYLYYNNPVASNNESSSTIWSEYEGVWLMNKSGSTYLDETSNNRNGTANGTLTDISGPVGNAINLNGSSTLKLTYNLANTLGRTSTLSFWIKTTQTGDNTDWRAPGVVGLSGTRPSEDLFYTFINASGRIGSSSGGGTQVQSNFVVNDNTWRYVTVSRNASNGQFKYYVNGVLNGSGNSGTGNKTSRSFFDFGATTKIWGGGGFIYFEGGLDSIRMSNTILSDDRVKAEYKFTTDSHVQFATPEDL